MKETKEHKLEMLEYRLKYLEDTLKEFPKSSKLGYWGIVADIKLTKKQIERLKNDD